MISMIYNIHVDLRFEMSMCEAYVEMVLEEDQTELQALEEEQSDEEDTIVAYNNNDPINLPSYSYHKGSKELVSQGEVESSQYSKYQCLLHS